MRHLLLLALFAGLGLAADPAPAAIQKLNDKGAKIAAGSSPTAFIIGESVDGLQFVNDDPRSTDQITYKYGSYQVEYQTPDSVDYLRGLNLEEQGDAAKAYDSFNRATQTARFRWVKEVSYLRAAQLALELKRLDDALAAVDGLEKSAPRSIWLDDALLVRGQAQAAKGDRAAAAKTYLQLTAMAKEWGDSAAVFGARGQAALLTADGKFLDAADLLTKLLARVDGVKSGAEVADLKLELADDLRQGGKADEAIAVLQGVTYHPAAQPLQQARAHVLWGQLLAGKADIASQVKAFDHAALATATRGADAAVVAAAKALALAVNDKLQKDPSITAADKAEYKRNLGSF